MASIQFSDTTNKSGIIQLVELNCGLADGGISGDSTLLKQTTALANMASSEVWHLIFKNNTGWIYDDSNNSDLPQATQNLVAGTSKYAIPSSALSAIRWEVMDSAGNFRQIYPITLAEMKGMAVDEFLDTDGMPLYYRMLGTTIELFPAPAASQVTTTGGLKAYFDRGVSTFASTDTTKTPGFASEYHDLISLKTSVKLLQIIKPDSPTLISLKGDEVKREAQLVEYELLKFKDQRPLVMRGRNTCSR
jgi:hypothetical protein